MAIYTNYSTPSLYSKKPTHIAYASLFEYMWSVLVSSLTFLRYPYLPLQDLCEIIKNLFKTGPVFIGAAGKED